MRTGCHLAFLEMMGMHRSLLAMVLLAVIAVGGCAGGTEDGDAATARPSANRTTATGEPTPTVTKEAPPETVTKKAPPPTVTTTVSPSGNPAPEGPTGACGYTTGEPELESGSSGAAVRKAQCYLNLSMAGEKLAEDGQFGPVTDAATKRFQRCAGITMDGLIGSETWSYLVLWANSPAYVC